MHLVEADEVEAAAAQIAHHTLEEFRRHLEQAVGLEAVGPRAAARDAASGSRRRRATNGRISTLAPLK